MIRAIERKKIKEELYKKMLKSIGADLAKMKLEIDNLKQRIEVLEYAKISSEISSSNKGIKKALPRGSK